MAGKKMKLENSLSKLKLLFNSEAMERKKSGKLF